MGGTLKELGGSRLENADSNLYYFTEGDFKDYLTSPEAIGIIGFLTGGDSVTEAICETDVEVGTRSNGKLKLP